MCFLHIHSLGECFPGRALSTYSIESPNPLLPVGWCASAQSIPMTNPTTPCPASPACFLILSQDNYRIKRRVKFIDAHSIPRRGVDMELQWVIWHLTSINTMWVTNAFLGLVRDKAALISGMIYACSHTQTLLWPAAPHWLFPLTVNRIPKQALPCWEGLVLASRGLPSHGAFILSSWFVAEILLT